MRAEGNTYKWTVWNICHTELDFSIYNKYWEKIPKQVRNDTLIHSCLTVCLGKYVTVHNQPNLSPKDNKFRKATMRAEKNTYKLFYSKSVQKGIAQNWHTPALTTERRNRRSWSNFGRKPFLLAKGKKVCKAQCVQKGLLEYIDNNIL